MDGDARRRWTAASTTCSTSLLTNLAAQRQRPSDLRLRRLLRRRSKRRLDQFNPASRARRNVAHHYDLNGRLYSLFLDRDRQYSCAYFPPGRRDAGGGAGGQEAPHRRQAAASTGPACACSTSAAAGAAWRSRWRATTAPRVTGITLRPSSSTEARARAAAAGLAGPGAVRADGLPRVTRTLRPDRLGRHVRACRRQPLPRVLRDACARCLEPDGVALLHAIGRSDGPGSDQSLDRQIHLPGRLLARRCREVMPPIEQSGLIADRHRGPAAALRRDAAPLAAALRRQPRRHRRAVRRAVLPDVRVLSRRLRGRVPPARARGCARSSLRTSRRRCR